MADDPLKPSPTLLCKLGSIIIHSEEMHSRNGHPYDAEVVKGLCEDPEVIKWLAQMRKMAMLPVKR